MIPTWLLWVQLTLNCCIILAFCWVRNLNWAGIYVGAATITYFSIRASQVVK